MKYINNKRHAAISIIANALLLVGAVLWLIGNGTCYYYFSFGTLMLITQALTVALQDRTADRRVRRQYFLNLIATLILGLGAYLMYRQSNSWIAMLLIYALQIIFLSFRGEDKAE